MKNKVAIIVAYFGKLPNWFQLWLNSCKFNKNFTWIIFTDDSTEYDYPQNVIRELISFESIRELISLNLDLDVNIQDPYKICDFKVAYGYIFRDYLKEYTHWGCCDIDMIFGDLSKFISDEILDKNDRVLNKGHLMIFKNTEFVNKAYELPYSGENYKYILKSKYHYGFDESAGLDKIYNENKLSQYIPKDTIIADIDFSKYRFTVRNVENYDNQYLYWDNGKVYRKYIKDSKEYEDEFAYIHFQKRRLKIEIKDNSKYLFYPNAIRSISDDLNLYELNRSGFLSEFKTKIRYAKIIFNQKRYRLIHWKLKL